MKRIAIKLVVFLLLGAVTTVAVAWAVFPGEPSDWKDVTNEHNVDQSRLAASGVQRFRSVDKETYRTFGFVDSWYKTSLDAKRDVYPFQFARETYCGWPALSLRGATWSPIELDEWEQRHQFVQRHIFVTAIPLSDDAVMLGQREYLPIGPVWPGFLINTLFYAVIVWLLWSAPFATRRLIRQPRGRCVRCGYDLRHAEHDACPECGENR